MERGILRGGEAVRVLTTLVCGEDDRWPLFLLGAGASFRSGVPTASEAVKQIARIVYSERKLLGSRPPERVKPSEWESWLREQRWFLPDPERIAENFPNVVEKLLVPAEFRKRVLLEIMNPVNGISSGYGIIADFVMRGLVRTILTTNFDSCLPDALRSRQPHIKHIAEVNRGPNDYDEFDVFSKCQIIWLHGKAEQYSDKNAIGEVSILDEKLSQLIRPLLRASPIIVIGYRGAEPSVMNGLFGQSGAGRLDFPNGVYWCVRPNQPIHERVHALADRLGSNFTFLDIDGFDESLQQVSNGLIGKDRFSNAQVQSRTPAARAFDERIVETASVDDLDLDLALSTLVRYCEKLGRAPLSRDSLLPLMREQGLLLRTETGTDKVTYGAILLFGKSTQCFIPQAVISVTEAGKRREVYDGNLISQYQKLMEKLESEEINPLLKLKKRRSHDLQLAYPSRVLVELLVNLLVHRDYEIGKSASIDCIPGDRIVFSNPGGLTPAMKKLLVVEEDGRIILSTRATDPRNVSLCDIFFGIRAMERAGTGLSDVTKLMSESSGTSEFFHSSAERAFTAVVRQAPSSGGSHLVAHSGRPTGIYILNVFPFSALPREISIVRLTTRLKYRPNTLSLDDCGLFVERSSDEKTELWSFAPLPALLDLLAPIVDAKLSRTVKRIVVEEQQDERRVLSWLLRRHLEDYLLDFEDDGLWLEGGRSHRAYFIGEKGANRTVVWDSSHKRGNRREVVKRRSEERPWFENEGFGYDVVNLSGSWGVRIKPFYMFTGHDAQTPLPAFTRTAKATRRMKWDKNKNVETDLAFWATYLGKGRATMNLGDDYADDLLVDCAFLTLEVPEPK
jgi:hypothetical protein